jgi:hypothetical protein
MSHLLSAIAAAFGSLALAAITYFLTKQRERDAQLRRETLNLYKQYVESLNGIIGGQSSPEGQKEYARNFNNLHLFAPWAVLEALHKYQKELHPGIPGFSDDAKGTLEEHNRRYTDLMREIRKDLNIKPKDGAEFKALLWSGGGNEETQRKR